MDNPSSNRENKKSLIEEKLKKILMGGKSPRQSSRDDQNKENETEKSDEITLQPIQKSGNFKENDAQHPPESKNDKSNLKLESRDDPANTNQHHNSVNFNDKFSFADKITFESEKYRNEELLNFNQYIKTDPENDTLNNDAGSVYSKKILKNNGMKKKGDSSFTSDRQNDSECSERNLQSFCIQDTLQATNIKEIIKHNSISNKTDNQYLHIIEYKLKESIPKNTNFNTHNLTRNDNNPLNTINANSNSYQNSINSSVLNSTLNTQKKESFNHTPDSNKISINNNTISTSSTVNKKPLVEQTNNKAKYNKNFDSNKNDLNKFLSKKEETKYKDIKTYINNGKTKAKNSNLNTSKDDGAEAEYKKTIPSSKSKDKKNVSVYSVKEPKTSDKPLSVDKPINTTKHVKTNSVSSVKNLKNVDQLLKVEPSLQQRSASNVNTAMSSNTTNIKKIKIDNININMNDDKKKVEMQLSQMRKKTEQLEKNMSIYKEKYFKNREKVKRANERILKLKTKMKIDELKHKVKLEKNNITESMQQIFEKIKKTQAKEANNISCESLETLLNSMNIKHPETVGNMLTTFKANKNINDSFINEINVLIKNDRLYFSLFETFGVVVNQLLLSNLTVRENDLKIIQNQQKMIDEFDKTNSEQETSNRNILLTKEGEDYDTIHLTDLSINEDS